MPRKRKQVDEFDEQDSEASGILEASSAPGLEPLPRRRLENGQPNPEYFRVQFSNIQRMQQHSLVNNGKSMPGYDQALKGLQREAEIHGVDLDSFADSRTTAQRVEDSIQRMIGGDTEALLEESEEVMKAMLEACENAISKADEILTNIREGVESHAETLRARMRKGKLLRNLLERAIRLRRLAQSPVPPGTHLRMVPAYEATHVLRFMVYVFRSDLAGENSPKHEAVFKIARHHAKIAVRYWLAREGVRYYSIGTPEEIKQYPDVFHSRGGWIRGAEHVEGLILLCPPRHGKSSIGSAIMALEINKNHRIQAAMTHAVDEKAAENMRHVAACFKGRGHKEENAMGRRNLSLFPASLAKRDNDDATLRLKCENPPRDPTLKGKGIRSSVGGSNLDFLWGDDIVNPEEAHQANQRNITAHKFKTQWMRRMQGQRPFVLLTVTLWHEDDTVGQLIKLARPVDGVSRIPFHVLRIPAGGPRPKQFGETTIEPWQPVWPEEYPSQRLRSIYYSMSPYDYSCQYEIDPISESDKLIKKLRVFCAAISPGEVDVPKWVADQVADHQRFMATAEMHYSIDPAATSRQRAETQKHKADKAGFVYCAVGALRTTTRKDGGVTVMETRNVVRVIAASEHYANPQDATARFGDFAMVNRVDKLHIEEIGVGLATSELIRNTYKLPSSSVIGHKPARRSKRERLREVAVMLDDSSAELGMPGATVEFAGIWKNGRVQLAEGLHPIWDQILNFGFTDDDHQIDACTQMLAYVAPSLQLGGVVSNQVRSAVEEVDTPAIRNVTRMQEALEKLGSKKDDKPEDDFAVFGLNSAQLGAEAFL